MDMPSTSNPNTCYHDVFINHRGPDVKETLATSLYKRLLSHNLRPFLDKYELEKGDYIDPQIENAIQTASIHIVIFSPKYAESRWCLDELLLILNKPGDTIFPIFYKVEISEVRWIKNRYAKALSDHEKKGRYDDKTLENWRIALNKASLIDGFELKADNEDKKKQEEEEAKLVEEVVEWVLKKRRKTPLYVADFSAGLQEKIEDFESVLSQQQKNDKARVLGIVGLGGVGKTTLARELFNRKRNDFNKSSFLHDVRETVRVSSLTSLQRNLLEDLRKRTEPIDSIEKGIEILRKHLSSAHALIVLDNVDDAEQLHAFLPVANVLHSNSLILVTSRYKNVLTNSGIAQSSIYQLTGLDDQYSRQLFCSHAFSQPHPLVGFENLVDEFCKACDGLPLSLKVFGALLYGKDNQCYWKGQLQKLSQELPNEIKERLKISYDALDEDEERKIFLDISCYFIGENRDMAIRIWDGSGWNGLVGLANLQDRCLVEVDTENNTIKMHDHLRDMGRQIVDQQKSCGVIPHREWRVMKDIPELWQQYSVITEVRGIRTIHHLKTYFASESTIKLIDPSPYRFSKLQLVATEGDDLKSILSRVESPNLIWLRWSDCPYNCLPPWLLILMKNIRVLEVSGKKLGTLWRIKSQAPLELRELTIHSSHSPLFEFPKSIGQLKHIEKIVVYSRSVELLPKEFCDLHSLKYLHCGSPRLKMLPDSFGCLTNLVHLDLSSSSSLQMLPNSFGNLIRLKHLNLDECSELTISNETFANVRSLEYLNLSSVRMEMLPWQVTHQQSLEELHLVGTNLQKLPEDITNLRNLEVLTVGSHSLKELPCSLGQLSRLKHMELVYCRELKSLPDSLGLLTQLSELKIEECGIESLPPEMEKLSNLVQLTVRSCPIPELPLKSGVEGALSRLEYLELGRTEISKICLVEGVCPSLKHLYIGGCNDLVEVGALPPTLIKLSVQQCDKLRKMEGLHNLTNLQELDIWGCKELEELPCLERLISLKSIYLNGCDKLKKMEGLRNLTNLQRLHISGCKELEELRCRERLISLKSIYLSDCKKVRKMEGLHNLTNLQELHISGCKELEELPCVERLISLERISLYGCDKLRKMERLRNLTNLQRLDIRGCKELEELPCLERLISLKSIYLIDCKKVRKMEGLHNLTNLQRLEINGCKELEELPCLERLISLKRICLYGCDKVRKMEGLHNLTNLKGIHISGCKELEELPCLERLISLKTMEVSGCNKVKKMEGLNNLTNLEGLHISGCKELEELPCLERLIFLKWIFLTHCDKVRKMEGLHNLTNLEGLHISGCKELEELPCLERLISLKWIFLIHCDKVRKMEGLHNLTNLQRLQINGCKELEELPCLERLISLKWIFLTHCDKVRKMEGLHNLTNLRELHIRRCKKVRKMEGLHNLTNLEGLHISGCKELEELPCLERLISLKSIWVSGCEKVRKMEGLHNLTNLQVLHISRCKELEELPCVERLISLKKIEIDMCCKLKRIEGLGQLTQLQECRVVVYIDGHRDYIYRRTQQLD